MLKRKIVQEPFDSVKIKHAFDMSDIEPENLRKEIKDYILNLYPFMASGLQYVNFKKAPDADGNAVGSIEYSKDGVLISIPIILDEYDLKEPTVGIYNNEVIPLDKEYLEHRLDYSEYGEQIKENELPANMQYITQTGLFQGSNPGVYKKAEEGIVGSIFKEDPNNPYHYYGTLLKRAADNTLSIDDDVYYKSAEMLVAQKLKEGKGPHTSISKDEALGKAPQVRKIVDDGEYRNVFIGGEVKPAYVLTSTFSIAPGVSTGSYAFAKGLDESQEHITRPTFDIRDRWDGPRHYDSYTNREWCYGDIYGSGYVEKFYSFAISRYMDREPKDLLGNYILIERRGNVDDGPDKIHLSIPYYVDKIESVIYGDKGIETTAMFVTDPESNKLCFIISDYAAEVMKINKDKLREVGLGHLFEGMYEYYLIPVTEKMVSIRGIKKDATSAVDGYSGIVEKVSSEYPNSMVLINKGTNLHTITVSDGVNMTKHADVSSDGALLLANYYTGGDSESINDYTPEVRYQFNGDISKVAIDRTGVDLLERHRGEFRKLAEHIKQDDMLSKVADIEEAVNKLVGVEESIDDEWIDTNNVLHLIDNAISKVAELLLMSRLGKNDISESILGRAMYALVKLSNEIRGVSRIGSY